MKVHPIETGFFSTDGGAMFGIVSKKVWSNKYPSDSDNRCPLAMRILFVDMGEHKVLFDTGVGAASVHGMEYYKFRDRTDIKTELEKIGYKIDDVTDVVLSHLHFDHCGGCIIPDGQGKFKLTFPQAVYWASRAQFNLSFSPSLWESDSYSPAVSKLLSDSGRLNLLDKDAVLFEGVSVKLVDGHTSGQLVSYINTGDNTIIYCGDVIPMSTHIMPLCIAAVDNNAETSVNEKVKILEDAACKDYILFFFHDAVNMAARVKSNRGRITVKEFVNLQE